MLTERAISILSSVLYWGCNILKLAPYAWDPTTFQLRRPSKFHLFVYNFHRCFQHFMGIFTVYRLVTNKDWGQTPDRQRVMHLIWLTSHALGFVVFLQFQRCRAEIMHFINSLWAYILKHRGETVKADYVSTFVVFGGIMMFINGPSHGTGMIEVPCTKMFVSSLFFPCRFPAEDSEGVFNKMPFFLMETYIVTKLLFIFAFNWAFVFLGLAWVRRELEKTRLIPLVRAGNPYPKWESLDDTFLHYRTCQRINILLNEAFKYYLEWFPTFLLGLISLLLFATIKVWYIKIHAYMLFPGCALRCFVEAMTPLAMAGKVNEESFIVLGQWSKRLEREVQTNKNIGWLKAFRRSCPRIVCTAGSLYTFENSIVLCTLNNTIQLTMNLLLMSNKKQGSVSDAVSG